MEKQKDLTEKKKRNIVQRLAQGKMSTEISNKLCCDNRTVEQFIANSNQARRRSDKAVIEKYQDENYLIKENALVCLFYLRAVHV